MPLRSLLSFSTAKGAAFALYLKNFTVHYYTYTFNHTTVYML